MRGPSGGAETHLRNGSADDVSGSTVAVLFLWWRLSRGLLVNDLSVRNVASCSW